MGKAKVVINKNQIFYLLLILPFCLPELLYFHPIMSILLKGWKMGVVIFSAAVFIQRLKKYIVQEWLLLLMFGEICIVSLSRNVFPTETIYIAAIFVIFEAYISKDAANYLKVCIFIMELMILINFVTILAFPHGMYSTIEAGSIGYTANWFLGYKNPMVRLMLPACALSHIYALIYDSRRTWKAWALTILSLATVICVDSSAGILGMAIFIIFIFIYKKGISKLVRIWSLGKSFLFFLIIDILIVGFRKQSMFSFLIENILQRSSENLTGRTTIWDAALNLLGKSPVIGFGEDYSSVMASKIYASHPHNYILYILMLGGIVAFVILAVCVFKESKALKQMMLKNMTYCGIVLGILTAFWAMGVAEALTGAIFFYPLFIFCHKMPARKER